MSIAPTEPKRFGKYQILGRVAVGGMAEIYKARLEGEGGFHRTFALKRILPHLTSRAEFVDMLVEEAKIAGLLSHANIVQIMDLGEVGGTYYIAMEYVDGPDLGRILRRCRDKGITLPVPHAAFVVIEVLKGLEYAHDRRVMRGGREMPLNIVHRDISPANVLISFQGEVKLTDFGIAKASVKALETVSGVIKGRFDYLSPEQAAGDKPDRRADVFATGVLLYECLTGRHPFKQRSEAATIDAIREGRYPSPVEVNPDVPYPLEVVLERALAVNPADRYQSATEMKEALDRFFHDAGFIFSHSTLAAFLKGLFPKEAAETARPQGASMAAAAGPALDEEDRLPTDEQDTRLLGRAPAPPPPAPAATPVRVPAPDVPDPSEDRPTEADLGTDERAASRTAPAIPSPDDPFGGADSTVRKPRPLGSVAAAPDMPSLAGAPMPAGFGEEATLIRPPPPGLSASDWDQAETVIKPVPPPLVQEQRHQVAIEAALPIQDTTVQRPPPQHDTQAMPAPRRQKTGWGLHLAYLGLVVLCSIVSLVLGVVLTQWRLGAVASDAQFVVPQHEPLLRVELPAGAALAVDGRPVPGPSPIDVPLTSGKAHNIEVTLEGHNPVSTRVTLGTNDVRVLSVQAERLVEQRR